LYIVIAKSTKKTYQILKTVLGKTNIPNESTIISEFFTLFKELLEEDHEDYFNYFRMLPNQFDYLHNLVKPPIHKSNTENY
jgi:hypothetical protein